MKRGEQCTWQRPIGAKVLRQERAWCCHGATVEPVCLECGEQGGPWDGGKGKSGRGQDPKGLRFGFYSKFSG